MEYVAIIHQTWYEEKALPTDMSAAGLACLRAMKEEKLPVMKFM